MGDARARAVLDRIIRRVAAIDPTPHGPEPTTTLAEVKAWDPLRGSRVSGGGRHSIDGFDTVYERAVGWGRMRRVGLSAASTSASAEALYDAETGRTYRVERPHVGTVGSDWLWTADEVHSRWMDCARAAWTKQREIDARNLTDDEVETLVALVDAVVSRHPEATSHVSWHVRMTQAQLRAALARSTAADGDWGRPPYRPYFLTGPVLQDDPRRALPFADQFRAFAPSSLIAGGARVLAVFDAMRLAPKPGR